jgi:hypothetical protein
MALARIVPFPISPITAVQLRSQTATPTVTKDIIILDRRVLHAHKANIKTRLELLPRFAGHVLLVEALRIQVLTPWMDATHVRKATQAMELLVWHAFLGHSKTLLEMGLVMCVPSPISLLTMVQHLHQIAMTTVIRVTIILVLIVPVVLKENIRTKLELHPLFVSGVQLVVVHQLLRQTPLMAVIHVLLAMK